MNNNTLLQYTIQPIQPEQTYSLRHAVLWPEKTIDYVKVPDDNRGFHYGAFLANELVAVISLFVYGEEARFRKFATHPAFQGHGIGTGLLRHVFAEAKRLGASFIWCDARLTAADFYRRFAMQPQGETFYKGEIPYSKFLVRL